MYLGPRLRDLHSKKGPKSSRRAKTGLVKSLSLRDKPLLELASEASERKASMPRPPGGAGAAGRSGHLRALTHLTPLRPPAVLVPEVPGKGYAELRFTSRDEALDVALELLVVLL